MYSSLQQRQRRTSHLGPDHQTQHPSCYRRGWEEHGEVLYIARAFQGVRYLYHFVCFSFAYPDRLRSGWHSYVQHPDAPSKGPEHWDQHRKEYCLFPFDELIQIVDIGMNQYCNLEGRGQDTKVCEFCPQRSFAERCDLDWFLGSYKLLRQTSWRQDCAHRSRFNV